MKKTVPLSLTWIVFSTLLVKKKKRFPKRKRPAYSRSWETIQHLQDERLADLPGHGEDKTPPAAISMDDYVQRAHHH